MRVHYAIAVIAVILAGVGVRLFSHSTVSADAAVIAVQSADMDVLQMHRDINDLPAQKIHDMTFIFDSL